MDPFRTGPTGLFATALVSLGKSGRFSLGVVPKPTAIANRPVSFDAKSQFTNNWLTNTAYLTSTLRSNDLEKGRGKPSTPPVSGRLWLGG